MEICQNDLPYRPWSDPGLARMPGLKPIVPGDWLQVDDAYEAQMAHRQALYTQRRPEVARVAPGAEPAREELLALGL
ncbi:MAG TPA: DUF3445 domain-containing protein, partial [Aliiroseovarius sp.]|nr:DUF3445 domain-containing protein [Aliiroseovarius sp.]